MNRRFFAFDDEAIRIILIKEFIGFAVVLVVKIISAKVVRFELEGQKVAVVLKKNWPVRIL